MISDLSLMEHNWGSHRCKFHFPIHRSSWGSPSPSWPNSLSQEAFIVITASSKMLSSFRFHNQHANGWVVQDLGEVLPDDSRDMTEAGAVETSSSARARVPILAGGIHGVTLKSSCTPSLKAHTPSYMLPGPVVGYRALL